MTAWLDTQTRELLQSVPPEKSAPAGAEGFTLVLLRAGPDRVCVAAAVQRVVRCGHAEALRLASRTPPVTLATGLSLEDALLAQFELVCRDCVSVFLADEVAEGASPQYLSRLYRQLLASEEFREVCVEVLHVPDSAEGTRFLDQFFGSRRSGPPPREGVAPWRVCVMRKKARLMLHWARKAGAEVRLAGE